MARVFLKNLMEIADDLSVYKNTTSNELLTECVDEKLNTHLNDYLKKLNNLDYYFTFYDNLNSIKAQFIFDLENLQRLIEIKDENLKKGNEE